MTMLKFFPITFPAFKISPHLLSAFLLASLSGCSPFYTWGYAKTIHPRATCAYIYAVMAEEQEDWNAALSYYDEALHYTWDENVQAQRDAVVQKLSEQKK